MRQLRSLRRIRDEGGLHQHRGNVRGLQHHEARLLHLRLAHGADAIQLTAAPARPRPCWRHAGGLRQIQQHRGEHGVLVVEQTPPFRSAAFSRSASQRAASLVAPRSDSTYTDEPDTSRIARWNRHGSTRTGRPARAARAGYALAQRDEVVAIAREHRLHARLGIDALRQRARDGQHHVFLARAARCRWRPDRGRRVRHRPRR